MTNINALPTDSVAVKVSKILHKILGIDVQLEYNLIENGLDSLSGITNF